MIAVPATPVVVGVHRGGRDHEGDAGRSRWRRRLDDEEVLPLEDAAVFGTEQERFVSNAWDLPCVGWPLAHTFGLTGSNVIHAMYGGAAPRSSGGFTIYRPWHWSLEGSDLYFGDLIGGRPDCIAAYEIDGCDFTMRDGLPYPTGKDGAPANLTIIAMAPVSKLLNRDGAPVPAVGSRRDGRARYV